MFFDVFTFLLIISFSILLIDLACCGLFILFAFGIAASVIGILIYPVLLLYLRFAETLVPITLLAGLMYFLGWLIYNMPKPEERIPFTDFD